VPGGRTQEAQVMPPMSSMQVEPIAIVIIVPQRMRGMLSSMSFSLVD
jgi:hypothetical protein